MGLGAQDFGSNNFFLNLEAIIDLFKKSVNPIYFGTCPQY